MATNGRQECPGVSIILADMNSVLEAFKTLLFRISAELGLLANDCIAGIVL